MDIKIDTKTIYVGSGIAFGFVISKDIDGPVQRLAIILASAYVGQLLANNAEKDNNFKQFPQFSSKRACCQRY